MCASFSGGSPVWNRRRQEESCGSLAQVQASARVDVMHIRNNVFFFFADQLFSELLSPVRIVPVKFFTYEMVFELINEFHM